MKAIIYITVLICMLSKIKHCQLQVSNTACSLISHLLVLHNISFYTFNSFYKKTIYHYYSMYILHSGMHNSCHSPRFPFKAGHLYFHCKVTVTLTKELSYVCDLFKRKQLLRYFQITARRKMCINMFNYFSSFNLKAKNFAI